MDCRDGGCSTAAVMFGVPGIAVLAAAEIRGELHLLVETTDRVGGCRRAGWSLWRIGGGSICCATHLSVTGRWC